MLKCWLPFWSHLLVSFVPWRVFDLGFEPSGGYPLGPILVCPEAHLVRFGRLFGRFQYKVAPNFKDSKATNGTNNTFKKQAGTQKVN